MINLRNQNPKVVYKNYQKLRRLIEGKDEIKEKKPQKKVKNNAEKVEKQNEKKEKKNENTCLECGGMLIEKSGISKKTGKPYHFMGCSNFPNCTYTRNIPDKEIISIVDQDSVDLKEIPF